MLKRSDKWSGAPMRPRREASRIDWRRGSLGSGQRIGLFGFFGIGNFGNDGSLEALLRSLHSGRPQADIFCICGVPEQVSSRLGIRAVPINWRPRIRLLRRLDRLLFYIPGELGTVLHAARHLYRMDALVIPGTGILDDYGTGPLGMPYWLFRWCGLARIFGTKVIFVNIGAGPVHNGLSRRLMKSAADMAVYRSYRDEESKRFMRGIGCETAHDDVVPDVAFSLSEPAAMRAPREEGSTITVGVGVMSYNGWRGDRASDTDIYESYLAKIESFVRWLLGQGYRVRLLMGDASDQATVERLMLTLVGKKAVVACRLVAEPASSLHDVMHQIVDTDVVVATRYHNVVCALKLGRPTLSIGYAAKNDELLTAMGLEEFCQHIETLDVELLKEQLARLIADRKSYERGLAEANRSFSALLCSQRTMLLDRYL